MLTALVEPLQAVVSAPAHADSPKAAVTTHFRVHKRKFILATLSHTIQSVYYNYQVKMYYYFLQKFTFSFDYTNVWIMLVGAMTLYFSTVN